MVPEHHFVAHVVAAGLLFSSALAHAAAETNEAWIPLATGLVVNDSGTRAALAAAGGETDAVDLRTGKIVWRSKAITVPLGGSGGRLLGVAESDAGHALELRVVDAKTGQLVKALPPVPLPAWAPARLGYGPGYFLQESATATDGKLRVTWQAGTFYWGGAEPTEQMEKAARKNAWGTVDVDLDHAALGATETTSGPPPSPHDEMWMAVEREQPVQLGALTVRFSREAVQAGGVRMVMHRTRGAEPLQDVVVGEATSAIYIHPLLSKDLRTGGAWSQAPNDPPFRYRVRLYALESGARMSDLEWDQVPVPLLVVEDRVIASVGGGVKLLVRNAKTGKRIAEQGIRRLDYAGPPPP